MTRSNGTRTNQCCFAYRKFRRLALEKHPARQWRIKRGADWATARIPHHLGAPNP